VIEEKEKSNKKMKKNSLSKIKIKQAFVAIF
jgi:hypothetical protein